MHERINNFAARGNVKIHGPMKETLQPQTIIAHVETHKHLRPKLQWKRTVRKQKFVSDRRHDVAIGLTTEKREFIALVDCGNKVGTEADQNEKENEEAQAEGDESM